MNRMLNVKTAAERLGHSEITIRGWANQRYIASVKLRRRIFIPESEIDRLIERNYRPALGEAGAAVEDASGIVRYLVEEN